jgi:hypothetical protein
LPVTLGPEVPTASPTSGHLSIILRLLTDMLSQVCAVSWLLFCAGVVCCMMWDNPEALFKCVNCRMGLVYSLSFCCSHAVFIRNSSSLGCSIVITMKLVYYLKWIFKIQKLLLCSCNHILSATTMNGVLSSLYTCLEPQTKYWCNVVSSSITSCWRVFDLFLWPQYN